MHLVSGLPSRRLQAVQDPIIPIIGDLIRVHPGTISLGQGMVHYPPPPEVMEAVFRATSDGSLSHRYGSVEGETALVDAIHAKLVSENGMKQGTGWTAVVTAGANMGFLNAILAVADPDDEIVLLTPFYFNHEMAVRIAGCRPVLVATTAAHQPDVDRIEAALTDRTRAVVTISPNNPTGAVYSAEVLRHINTLCATRGIYHIHDEAYEYFLHGAVHAVSPGSLPDAERHTISLYSLSKAYGMAGWRIGYMVIPSHLRDAVQKIQDTNLICPPRVCQVAAQAALAVGRSWCEAHLPALSEVRGLVLDALGTLGDRIVVSNPAGAFYVFIRLRTPLQDEAIARLLIAFHRVAVIPGSTFGATDECTLRIAYGALQRETVAEAMQRLVSGLNDIL